MCTLRCISRAFTTRKGLMSTSNDLSKAVKGRIASRAAASRRLGTTQLCSRSFLRKDTTTTRFERLTSRAIDNLQEDPRVANLLKDLKVRRKERAERMWALQIPTIDLLRRQSPKRKQSLEEPNKACNSVAALRCHPSHLQRRTRWVPREQHQGQETTLK